MAKLLEIN